MAVIPSIPGLEATIVVNGVTAVEYQNPDAEESHTMAREEFDLPVPYDDQALPYVVKYIETKPGSPFKFHVNKKVWFRQRNHHIAYRVSLDGHNLGLRHQPAESRRCKKREWDAATNGYFTGNPTAGYETHFFQFAALDIGMVELPRYFWMMRRHLLTITQLRLVFFPRKSLSAKCQWHGGAERSRFRFTTC
jgi:hypothetical protein